MIFYFTGTGNSLWVANRLCEELNDRMCFIPDAIKSGEEYTLHKGEKLGFVFPVYAWRVPKFILKFIDNLKITNVDYVYFVATCGDDTGIMSRYFITAAKRKGWNVACGFSVVMPEVYISLPGFNVDTKDNERKKLRDATGRLDQISTFIADSRKGTFDTVPGVFPWTKSKLLGAFFNGFLMSPKPFHTTSDCVSCGKCAEVCPMTNIRMDEKTNRPVWGGDCVGCLRCYHSCPKKAIQYGRFTKGKGQYLNPNVKLK